MPDFESQGCQIFSFLIFFHKNDAREIKIGHCPYFRPRNQIVIFLKFHDQQGCQILNHRVARYLVFSIYFHKNDVREIKHGDCQYFGPRNPLVIFSKPYDQHGCQILHHRVAKYLVFQFISIKTMSETPNLAIPHILDR